MSNYRVFGLVGQSNVGGQGNGALSPIVPTGKCLKYIDGVGLADANDPIHPAQTVTGSAWPAFCLHYYNATQKNTVVAFAGVGGSSQIAAADLGVGNWDVSGTLYADSIRIFDDALAAVTGAGHTPEMAGIIIVNAETDALKMNLGAPGVTPAAFKTALGIMCANYRAYYGNPQLPVYLVQLGTYKEAPEDYPGYQAMRRAKREYCQMDPYTYLVYPERPNAVSRGFYGIGSHDNQYGLNDMGRAIAEKVVGVGRYTPRYDIIDGSEVYNEPYLCISLPTGYSGLLLELDHFEPVVGGAELRMIVSLDDGTSYKVGGSDYTYITDTAIPGVAPGAPAGGYNNYVPLAGPQAALAGFSSGLVMHIGDKGDMAKLTNFMWDSSYWNSGSTIARVKGAAAYQGAMGRITDLQLFYNSGNIGSLRYSLSGKV